ncbi:MAG: amidohydrolase family protein [Dehalococcoidia bacterium]
MTSTSAARCASPRTGIPGLKIIGTRRAYDDYKSPAPTRPRRSCACPSCSISASSVAAWTTRMPTRAPGPGAAATLQRNCRACGRLGMCRRPGCDRSTSTPSRTTRELRIIGAHMGGTGNYDEASSVVRWRHHVYLDMSGGDTIDGAVGEISLGKEIGPEKLTWGSDCRDDEIAEHVRHLETIFDQVGLSEDQADRIRYRNAAEIFGEVEPTFAVE